MTISIDFPSATLSELMAEARTLGKNVETIVREAVDSRLARRNLSFDEVLAPIHEAIEASGLSEEEVDALFDKELKNLRAENCLTVWQIRLSRT